MKLFLLLIASLLSQLAFANSDYLVCPEEWPVQVVQSETIIAMQVHKDLIENQDLVGDYFWKFNNNDLRISQKKLLGKFTNKDHETQIEVAIGTISEQKTFGSYTCYKIETEKTIQFTEEVHEYTNSCMMPITFGCGSSKFHNLNLTTKSKHEAFNLAAEVSVIE